MITIAKIKYLLFARKVPIVRFADDCQTIEFTKARVCSNHLMDDWNQRGYELAKAQPKWIVQNGKPEIGYAVHPKGVVIDLKDDVKIYANGCDRARVQEDKVISVNYEGVIGKLSSIDMLEDSVDLVGSNKKIFIGILIGCALWAVILGPLLQKVLS